MKFVWDERNADIGNYDLWVESDDGEKLQDSEISFWDYTCDFQKNSPFRDKRKKDIAYEWCWCHGWSHSEAYKYEEHLTLIQAKRRAELWLAQKYVDNYNNCLASIARLKPLAEWAENEIGKERTNE